MDQPLGVLGTPVVGFFSLIILGGLAGWLAGMIMGIRNGIFTNILIGIVGSWIGSYVADNFLHFAVAGYGRTFHRRVDRARSSVIVVWQRDPRPQRSIPQRVSVKQCGALVAPQRHLMTVVLDLLNNDPRKIGAAERVRHPEKAHRPDQPIARKPAWIRVKAPGSEKFAETQRIVRQHGLVTVCEEAGCPNIGECWEKKHATFMIMGDTCTRACAFCNVRTGMPEALEAGEPERVADAVAKLGLAHVVVTSVDRDDLSDGGAGAFPLTRFAPSAPYRPRRR